MTKVGGGGRRMMNIRSRAFWGEEVCDFAADHGVDDFGFVGGGGVASPDGGAVAQDGDAVGEGEDFVETVRDVDTAQAAGAEVAKDAEQGLDFVLGEGGGGFVEDEDAGI